MGSQSLYNEYITKNMSASKLENELQRLAEKYNKHQSTFLFIMATDMDSGASFKGGDVSLNMQDFHVVHELLRHVESKNIDIYLETPGGSGEAAEEIVTFLHENFENVNFVVAGEAKSAGTLMTLSADEIYMTQSGSLGPVDAQVRIGRSTVSAFDYVEWVERIRREVVKGKRLNAVDATMIAQITPGEFEGVFHAQEFAKDCLKQWLPKYKFKHWSKTETSQIEVSEEMKKERAETIAQKLIDRESWRSHARSLKIKDLENIGLRIKNLDQEDPPLCETVYRIRTVLRLLFAQSSHYKAFVTKDERLFKDAMKQSIQAPLSLPKINPPQKKVEIKDARLIEIGCPKCGIQHKMLVKFAKLPKKVNQDLNVIDFPKNNKLICNCGYKLDLLPHRNQIEKDFGKKIID